MKAASQGGREPRLPRPGPVAPLPRTLALPGARRAAQERRLGVDGDLTATPRVAERPGRRSGDPPSLAAHLPHLPARSGSEAPFQRPTGRGSSATPRLAGGPTVSREAARRLQAAPNRQRCRAELAPARVPSADPRAGRAPPASLPARAGPLPGGPGPH